MFKMELLVMLLCPHISTDFRPFGCQIGCQTSETSTTSSPAVGLSELLRTASLIRPIRAPRTN